MRDRSRTSALATVFGESVASRARRLDARRARRSLRLASRDAPDATRRRRTFVRGAPPGARSARDSTAVNVPRNPLVVVVEPTSRLRRRPRSPAGVY
jgi:hypothetical protein